MQVFTVLFMLTRTVLHCSLLLHAIGTEAGVTEDITYTR
jgi:hypothetical protein